jgi:dTDP-4-dehydrorhamnose reductase
MILLTGGSGLLGRHLVPLIECVAPTHEEFDILNPHWRDRPDFIIHCAAYTDVALAEKERNECFEVNVDGTKALVDTWVPLLYISTEYVFDGRKGMYKEDDRTNPVNLYAESKLEGEQEALRNPLNMVLRLLFKPRPFEHPRACVDQWTSGDYVDVMAPIVAKAVRSFTRGMMHGIWHVGTGRKSTFDLARQTRSVRPIKRKDVESVKLPKDTSLDTTKWDRTWT